MTLAAPQHDQEAYDAFDEKLTTAVIDAVTKLQSTEVCLVATLVAMTVYGWDDVKFDVRKPQVRVMLDSFVALELRRLGAPQQRRIYPRDDAGEGGATIHTPRGDE